MNDRRLLLLFVLFAACVASDRSALGEHAIMLGDKRAICTVTENDRGRLTTWLSTSDCAGIARNEISRFANVLLISVPAKVGAYRLEDASAEASFFQGNPSSVAFVEPLSFGSITVVNLTPRHVELEIRIERNGRLVSARFDSPLTVSESSQLLKTKPGKASTAAPRLVP